MSRGDETLHPDQPGGWTRGEAARAVDAPIEEMSLLAIQEPLWQPHLHHPSWGHTSFPHQLSSHGSLDP